MHKNIFDRSCWFNHIIILFVINSGNFFLGILTVHKEATKKTKKSHGNSEKDILFFNCKQKFNWIVIFSHGENYNDK